MFACVFGILLVVLCFFFFENNLLWKNTKLHLNWPRIMIYFRILNLKIDIEYGFASA